MKATKSSTQKFTEIKLIQDNIVLFNGGNACAVIEVQASNFSLLSKEEQDIKIYSYASLLNSLSFPLQILVRNKKLDISNYLTSLDEQANKTQNERLAMQIRLYRDFVAELIKVNTVLDKKFYMIVPYSPLEKGAQAMMHKGNELDQAKTALDGKVSALMDQIGRLALRAKPLQTDDLVTLYYEMYNGDFSQTAQITDAAAQPIVTGAAAQIS